MKHLLFLTIVLVFAKTIKADPPRRDTIPVGWTPETVQIMQAPVVMGQTQPITIEPNTQKICFDKHILVKSLVNGQMIEQCLWLNTKDGLIGHLKPARSGGISLCDIKPDEVDFSFFIYGLKGNTYHFFTRKPKQTIEHYVSTSNSQTYLYEAPVPAGTNTGTLHLKTDTRMYCNDKYKGKAYKFDGGGQTWYLFGPDYPETLTWEAYLGNFGVGYLKTNKGLYVIMEMETSTGNSFKITDIQDQDVCFNPVPFKIVEDEFYQKRRQELDHERQKIDEEEAKLSQGTCQSERRDVLNFKKEELRKQEENLENSMVGNSMQNVQTQQALLKMMDPEEILRQTILETKVSICKAEDYISKHPGPDAQDAVDRRNCLQDQLSRQIAGVAEMEALDTQYASNPGMAYAKKNQKYWEILKTMPACN